MLRAGNTMTNRKSGSHPSNPTEAKTNQTIFGIFKQRENIASTEQKKEINVFDEALNQLITQLQQAALQGDYGNQPDLKKQMEAGNDYIDKLIHGEIKKNELFLSPSTSGVNQNTIAFDDLQTFFQLAGDLSAALKLFKGDEHDARLWLIDNREFVKDFFSSLNTIYSKRGFSAKLRDTAGGILKAFAVFIAATGLTSLFFSGIGTPTTMAIGSSATWGFYQFFTSSEKNSLRNAMQDSLKIDNRQVNIKVNIKASS